MEETAFQAGRNNMTNKIADHLRLQIVLQKYAPGDRLIEMDLKNEFNVSRTTVRTALQMLESEGLIRMLSNGGKEVIGFSQEHASDMYDLRELLECYALQICIEGNPDYSPMLSILSTVNQIIHQNREVDSDYFADLDIQYHRAIVTMSRNLALLRCWETMSPMICTLLKLNSDDDYREHYIQEFTDKHQLILNAIIQKDTAAIEKMRIHIRDARDMSIARLNALWKQ